MARANPQIRRDHSHLFVGRIRRATVDGELVGVTLDLLRDHDQVEIADGDEFVTVLLAVDPFTPSGG